METKVSLSNLVGGGLEEQFQHALEQALANISDLNTDPKKTRVITISVKLLPTEDRQSCAVSVSVSQKGAPIRDSVTTIYIQKDGLGVKATEYRPNQKGLFSISEAQHG